MAMTTEFEGDEDLAHNDDSGHVGMELQQARQAQGVSLESVSETLRIKPGHLRALEEGWWDELPAEAYVLGFLKCYARYLGLDSAAVVCRYREESGSDRPEPRLVFPEPVDEGRVPKAPLMILSGFLAMMAYSVWYFTADSQRTAIDDTGAVPPHLVSLVDNESDTVSVPSESDIAVAAVAPASAPDSSLPSVLTEIAVDLPERHALVPVPEIRERASPEVVEAGNSWASVSDGLRRFAASAPSLIRPAHAARDRAQAGKPRVLVRATADTWIQVEDAEHNTLRQGVLKAGEEYEAPDAAGLTLTTTNAGALEVVVGDTAIAALGPNGAIKRNLSLDANRLVRAPQGPRERTYD